jgi:hypothetical protein
MPRSPFDWRRGYDSSTKISSPSQRRPDRAQSTEVRLFSFISHKWRAQPLVSYRVIVELISATTTKTGLTVRCQLDPGQYPSGIVASGAAMAALNIKRAEFQGEWNHTISPNTHPPNCAPIP